MSLLISGGTVVSATDQRRADVFCIDGQIAAVIDPGTAQEPVDGVLDVTGLYVLPGLIDPHVHSRDPGQTHKEDIVHATRAAAAGGITTLLEMPNAIPAVVDSRVLAERAAAHGGRAHVDFGLWALALGKESAGALAQLRSAGAVAAKVFWGFYFDRSSGRLVYNPGQGPREQLIPPASPGELWELLSAAANAGLPIGVHSEDRSILDAAARLEPTPTDHLGLLRARPQVAESVAVATLIELARSTGGHAHVVHISSGRSVELLARAQADGVRITAETCPHYLTLTVDDFPVAGSAMKTYPPVRTRADQETLWEGLLSGTIGSVGSDHAPHSLSERSVSFAEQPAGAVAVETMVPLMLDQVVQGRMTLPRLVSALSEETARIFGLYPRKGAIVAGADADFTIVDLARRWRIDNGRLHSKTRVSPWHGREGIGAPVISILRGQVIARDGEPVGDPGGRFVVPLGASRPALTPIT